MRSTKTKSADLSFLGFLAISLAAFYKPLIALIAFSWNHEYCSHIILIPLISGWLFYVKRNSIRNAHSSWAYGVLFALPAIPVLFLALRRTSTLDQNDFLAATTFSIVCIWISGFAVCYGPRAFRAAIFPLLVLLLMIPLPTIVLQAVTRLLQQGSTEITWWLLQALGQPSHKEGFTIYMPTLTILVAEECSGIRSSLALFITCLLGGHMMLRSNWRRTVFVLLAFPVALLKNGIRITTLVLLSTHVDMRFMTSSLHKDGGFAFFFIALLIMYPVLRLLQRHDVPTGSPFASNVAPSKRTVYQ